MSIVSDQDRQPDIVRPVRVVAEVLPEAAVLCRQPQKTDVERLRKVLAAKVDDVIDLGKVPTGGELVGDLATDQTMRVRFTAELLECPLIEWQPEVTRPLARFRVAPEA